MATMSIPSVHVGVHQQEDGVRRVILRLGDGSLGVSIVLFPDDADRFAEAIKQQASNARRTVILPGELPEAT